MLNKKIILSILILGLLIVSAASAADNATNEVDFDEGSNNNILGVTDNNQTSNNENTGTFDDLSNDIKATASGGVLNLTRNYKYTADDPEDIFISKAITIEGNGYTLDGNENANMFTVTNSDDN